MPFKFSATTCTSIYTAILSLPLCIRLGAVPCESDRECVKYVVKTNTERLRDGRTEQKMDWARVLCLGVITLHPRFSVFFLIRFKPQAAVLVEETRELLELVRQLDGYV